MYKSALDLILNSILNTVMVILMAYKDAKHYDDYDDIRNIIIIIIIMTITHFTIYSISRLLSLTYDNSGGGILNHNSSLKTLLLSASNIYHKYNKLIHG